MRRVRLLGVCFAVLTLAAVAACGGGGGGSTTPPVPKPTSNPGGTPPPHPTATATATPTASPSSPPTATPTASPTPRPTATPSPTPTASASPTPTPTPTPVPTATPTPNSTLTIQVGFGEINGTDNQILSSAPNNHGNAGEGDLMPGDPGAQPQGGGQGAMVDGIPTAATMSDNYHVHAFLGLYVNGQEVAIPDAIGMVDPFGDFDSNNPCTGGANNFECYADGYGQTGGFYYMHTHDASGMIHMEAPSPVCHQPPTYQPPCNMSIFTFGNFLDIWGISLTPNNFGPFQGPVQIYTGPTGYQACTNQGACYSPSNQYTLYTGDPTQIQMYSHTVIWILVGMGNPTGASLPNIEWMAGNP
jgi:hypothetical protein